MTLHNSFKDMLARKVWRDNNLTKIDVNTIVIYFEIIVEILELKTPFVKEDIYQILTKYKFKANGNTATQYLRWMVENGLLNRFRKENPRKRPLSSFGKYSRYYYIKEA